MEPCETNADCLSGTPQCDTFSGVCRQCLSDAHCGPGQTCGVTRGICIDAVDSGADTSPPVDSSLDASGDTSASDTGTGDVIDDMVTITVGIYGQTLTYDDVGGGLSAMTDPLSIESGGTEVANTGERTSSFYEVMLDPGTYQVCTDFGSCSPDVTITDGLQRCDFEAGPGGGMWMCR